MVIERKIIDRISIDPNLSRNVKLLVEKIDGTKGVELLKIEFESSGKSKKKEDRGFGKDEKVKGVFTGSSIYIPKQVHKITNNYTITDLLDAIDAFEIYAIRKDPTYTFDAYPVSLTLLDKGRSPNYAQHITVFGKVRKIKKESSVAKILGNIHMPIDLIGLYKAEYNKKAMKDDNKSPYRKTEVIRDIKSGEKKFVDADDIYRYTGNLYHSEFTAITTCEVGIETKKTKTIIPIEGGGCSIKKKRPDITIDENKDDILNNDTLDDVLDVKDERVIKRFTEKKRKQNTGSMATYPKEETE